MSDPVDNSIIAIFLDEVVDILATWERSCLQLEVEKSADACDALFRAAHNLKGASLALGFTEMGEFVHCAEDMIGLLRVGKLHVSPNLIKILLTCHMTLKIWIEALREDPTGKHAIQYQGVLTELQQLKASVLTEHLTAPSLLDNAGPNAEKAEPESSDSDFFLPPFSKSKNSNSSPEEKSVTGDTVRVPASRLDELIQLSGELTTQLNLLSFAANAGSLSSPDSASAINQSLKVVKDFQHRVLDLRMHSLQTLFQIVERVVRDRTREDDKSINIEFSGENIELDKLVIDAIADSLIHIVTNAVIHGVESETVRKEAGKPISATLSIHATQEPHAVKIVISDDGCGIDPDKVRRRAEEMGLIDSHEDLSEVAILNLICKPGFSTTTTVTQYAGRGVGMDIVKKSIEEIGGSLGIASEVGNGTRFIITVPLSLSLVDALVVSIDNLKYAVPIREISQIVDVNEFKTSSANRNRAIMVREQVIPVERLDSYVVTTKSIKCEQEPRPAGNPAGLIVEHEDGVVLFEVDQVIGHYQFISHKLTGFLKSLPGATGGMILGNGEPGVILNLASIARQYFDRSQDTHIKERRANSAYT